jgi:acyl carrier protein phosphodiesterase
METNQQLGWHVLSRDWSLYIYPWDSILNQCYKHTSISLQQYPDRYSEMETNQQVDWHVLSRDWSLSLQEVYPLALFESAQNKIAVNIAVSGEKMQMQNI